MTSSPKIYRADANALENAELFAELYSRASARRREKINRLRQERDKRLSLAVDALLKFALAEFGVEPDEPIGETPYGKPYLLRRPDVRFNASHSGDQVLCVVAREEVGCDVEAIAAAEPDLAERVLRESELEQIAALDDVAARKKLFCRLWTLKESFMKATGRGFALNPRSFAIDLSADEPTIRQSVDANDYSFCEYDLADDYCRACCVQNGAVPNSVIEADLFNLAKRT